MTGIETAASTPLSGPQDGRLRRAVGLVLVLLSVASSIVSFLILTNLTPIEPTADTVSTILIVDVVLIIAVTAMLGLEVWRIASARRRRAPGAHLNARIVATFSALAAIPAIFAAIGFTVALDRGLDDWFGPRMTQVVDSVDLVGEAYAGEVRGSLATELHGIGRALSSASSSTPLSTVLASEFDLRLILYEAIVVDRNGTALLGDWRESFEPILPDSLTDDIAELEALVAAGTPFAVVTRAQSPSVISGLVMITAPAAGLPSPFFIYGLRPINPEVPPLLAAATAGGADINAYLANRADYQLVFAVIFSGLTLSLLLGAIWVGIAFSGRLVAPIRRLIGAADEVANGNLSVSVPVRHDPRRDDVDSLGDSFNSMTAQLRSQRNALLAANEESEQRRHFTEAVLAGVTAGVIGLSRDGRVTLANRSAGAVLGFPPGTEVALVGRLLAREVPELGPYLDAAAEDDSRNVQGVVTLARGGRERTVSARVTSDRASEQDHGYVVTLDDITDLVAAQRTSAWADVARRIAHEIKNPLTPIQLSAERIRRRYGKTIGDDKTFNQCVDTIIRQVGDIGRMVEEFSSFARMPKPAMEERDLASAIREAVFLISVGHPEIDFRTDLPEGQLKGRFDYRLISQVITNLAKNAAEAIDALPPERRVDPRVEVRARAVGGDFEVRVIDNGIGLPAENRQRLLEPYMTTRERGTGLGLAIVTKIVEDHGGRLELLDAPQVAEGGHGAMVLLVIPQWPSVRRPAAADAAPQPAPEPAETRH